MLSLITLTFTNCAKEEVKQTCEINNTGEIKFQNSTSQTIYLTLDGSNYSISSMQTSSKDVSAGLHTYSAVSADGQWTWSGTVDVIQCETGGANFII